MIVRITAMLNSKKNLINALLALEIILPISNFLISPMVRSKLSKKSKYIFGRKTNTETLIVKADVIHFPRTVSGTITRILRRLHIA